MNFAQPYWLLAGLVACLFLLWRYGRFNRLQRTALAQFVSPRLFDKLTASVSASRRKLKQGLFIAGVACLFVALARPQVGFRWEEVHRKGIELLVAVDTSKSMLTDDVKPNRLGRAKLAVDDLVKNLDGDGVGLLAFAGDSFLQCPITIDYDAFRESLDSLDTNTIPRGGTDIGGAIREAQAVLDARPSNEKILVLITDGEDLGGDAVAAAQSAAKDGMKIFTVGVGTTAGELIPVPGANGGTDFVKDPSGQFVKSSLDEASLKQIAQATGGMYEPLGQQGQGLAAIYDRGLAPFMRHDIASRRTKVPFEQFQWPLLAALLCFVSEMLVGTRKHGRRAVAVHGKRRPSDAASIAGSWPSARAAAAVALALFIFPAASHASPTSAEKAYKQGDYSKAEKEYAATLANQPKQAELQFNLGAAAYKSGDYSKAAAAFQDTLNTTQVPLQQSAYYNLGNTQYRVGQATEKSKPQDTIKTWQQAVQSYEAALQIKPDDTDAKFNRDLVKQKLDELQKQQQKQNQQNQDQQQNQQNKDQQNQQNSGQSQNQDQSKQDQKNQGQGQSAQNQQDQKGQQQSTQNQQSAQSGSRSDKQTPAHPDKQSAQNGQPQPPQPGQDKDSGKPGQGQARAPQSPNPGDQNADNSTGGQSQNQPEQSAQAAPDKPGQMSKAEANQLLDSLKGDEHSLPAAQLSRGPAKAQDNQPLKDW
jgi:Ca-activated chloride channel family protein